MKTCSPPLVSIIIPNYNHARFLKQRLDSVLNQTYPNFEVIILDDCSTDNSMEVINQYKNDPHISHIVINDTNSGKVFKQWNKGLVLAKGELIWIAESDDFCELNMLEILVKECTKRRHVVLAYAPTAYVDIDGKLTGAYSKEGRTQYYSGAEYIKKYLTINNGVYNASCAIFSREAALAVNQDFMKYKGIGDWWFWLYVAQKGNVVIVNKHLNYFRQHGNNTTAKLTYDGTNIKDIKILLDFIYSHYHIPKWKKHYIDKLHRDCYTNIQFINDQISEEIRHIWQLDCKSSKWERFYSWILNGLQRRFLLRL